MSIVTTATGQKYVVLIGLPGDQALPFNGMDEGDLVALVQEKVSGPGRAGDFWAEASYGKTTFTFDVHGTVLDLPEETAHYYRRSRARTIDGAGASFPITWAGDRTLEVDTDENVSLTLSFVDGTTWDLATVVQFVNGWAGASSPDPSDPVVVAEDGGGQLRLRTRRKAADAKLEVGGTALTELGLDPAHRTVTEGGDLVGKRKQLVQDLLGARVDGLDFGEVRAAVGDYDGVVGVIVGTRDDFRAGAQFRAEEFPLGPAQSRDGEPPNYELSWFAITTHHRWEVYAHEIGHNLRLPDLYEEPRGSLAGNEVGDWDVMHTSIASHPTAWNKTYGDHPRDRGEAAAPWMDGVAVVRPPDGPDPSTFEALVAPSEAPLPTPNPFAQDHPDLPFVHAVRIDLEGRKRGGRYEKGNRSLYVENRQRAGFYAAPFADPQFDTAIPGDGVIVTDAVDSPAGVLVARAPVRLADPEHGPLAFPGRVAVVHRFGVTSNVRVEVVDRVRSTPPVYHVRVTWGPADRFDYRITPWTPPPWESADVWVDTDFANGWDEYKHSDPAENPDVSGNPVLNGDESRVGWTSRLYARVHNDGNVDRAGVPVRFEVVLPAAIGPAAGQLVGQTRVDVPKRGSALARVDWTPQSTNEGHVCLRVLVGPDTDELSELNNEAQENLTEWYAEASSPYAPVPFLYQVANPFPWRTPVRLRVRGLTPGWTLEVDPYEFQLDPGEVLEAVAVLRADDRVLPDDVLVGEGLAVPTVSLEGLVLSGHTWVPFGGVSGVAHAVRKTALEVDAEPAGDGPVFVVGRATSRSRPAGGPVAGAAVGLRVFEPGGRTVAVARARTGADGRFEAEVQLPPFSGGSVFALDAVLAPTLGYGPAEADIVEFTDRGRVRRGPRERFGLGRPALPDTPGPVRRRVDERVLERARRSGGRRPE